MLLWNISKQTEIANAIRLGQQGCMYNYKDTWSLDQKKGPGVFSDLKISYASPRDNKCDVSAWNASRVEIYWDQNKPKPP